jgi:hypothetical protein
MEGRIMAISDDFIQKGYQGQFTKQIPAWLAFRRSANAHLYRAGHPTNPPCNASYESLFAHF